MRKNFGAKPILYPQPVFIIATYNSDGTPNAMNAAWGGISENDEISMCISAEHRTTKNALERKAFTVSMAGRLISKENQGSNTTVSSKNQENHSR